jgi:hypothetical protein
MSIEFLCGECNSLLRVGDDSVGKGARCPHCGNIEIVPPQDAKVAEASFAEPPQNSDVSNEPVSNEPVSNRPELTNATGESPNAQASFAKSTFSQPDTYENANPFAAPQVSVPTSRVYTMSLDQAKNRVLVPAIFIVILSALGLIGSMFLFFSMVLEMTQGRAGSDSLIAFVFFGFGFLTQVIGVAGGVLMIRMSHWKLCMASAIVTIVGGMSCCFLPSAIGIWALVVLADQNVKQYFR